MPKALALDKNNHQRCSQTDFALPGPREEPLVSWQHFNYQKTLEAGGRRLYDDLIFDNFISHSVREPCTMREVVEQIAKHSQKPIPIESLADCLSRPLLPRGKVLFGCPGICVDQVEGNYDNLEWWISNKGLNISIGRSPSIRKSCCPVQLKVENRESQTYMTGDPEIISGQKSAWSLEDAQCY